MKKLLLVLLLASSYLFGAINLQTASKSELMSIAGIGSKKADAIISYRKKHKIKSADDLLNVKGIGKGIVKNVKGDVKSKSHSAMKNGKKQMNKGKNQASSKMKNGKKKMKKGKSQASSAMKNGKSSMKHSQKKMKQKGMKKAHKKQSSMKKSKSYKKANKAKNKAKKMKAGF